RRAEDPGARAAQAAVGLGVARLGALARHPQRAGARSGAGRVHPDDARKVREGSGAREERARQSPGAMTAAAEARLTAGAEARRTAGAEARLRPAIPRPSGGGALRSRPDAR